jgi:hypothetical protein
MNFKSMITIAVFSLVILHPGLGFQKNFNTLQCESTVAEGSSKEAVSLIGVHDLRRPEVQATTV